MWERENQIITSLDFAKQNDILPSLASTKFDLVIIDEAHKMSAYRYGDKPGKTARYKLGEVLSKSTDHLLFLIDTPRKGDTENFHLTKNGKNTPLWTNLGCIRIQYGCRGYP